MNEILINAFVNAVKVESMKIEEVPIPFQEEVTTRLEPIGMVEENGGDE